MTVMSSLWMRTATDFSSSLWTTLVTWMAAICDEKNHAEVDGDLEVEVETSSEGREDVELVWDDWGHERYVRDHTGDGWDHVEAVVVVGESTKSDKLTAADSWTDEALPVGWRNPIFLVETYRFTEVVSWKDKALN